MEPPDKPILLAAVLGFVIILALARMSPEIPTINYYLGDIWRRKAHAAFISNARGLLKEGTAKVSFLYFFFYDYNFQNELCT